MADGKYAYREVRFIIEDELTQCYIALEADAECPIGVQGWHHKTFPASKTLIDILKTLTIDKPVLWSLEAPPSVDTPPEYI